MYRIIFIYSMKIQLTEKQLKTIILNETRTEDSLTKRSNLLYKALKNGKFNLTLADIVYRVDGGAEVLFKGIIEYSLPDDYSTELIKDEDKFRLGIKRGGYNHIRYHIKEQPEFRFTGKLKVVSLDNTEIREEEFFNEPIHNINLLSFNSVNKRMNKFFEDYYNVDIKRSSPYETINEDKHSSKEVKKLIAWSMKHMGCYYTESTDGIKLCPPDYVKDQCRPTHLSDKALYPMMRDIAKWFGATKHDVERAFRGNRPL